MASAFVSLAMVSICSICILKLLIGCASQMQRFISPDGRVGGSQVVDLQVTEVLMVQMGQAEGLAVQGLTNELQVGPVLHQGGFLWLCSHLFPKIRLTKHKITPCSHTGLSQPVLPHKDVRLFLPSAS